jgi:hypothetical protein
MLLIFQAVTMNSSNGGGTTVNVGPTGRIFLNAHGGNGGDGGHGGGCEDDGVAQGESRHHRAVAIWPYSRLRFARRVTRGVSSNCSKAAGASLSRLRFG